MVSTIDKWEKLGFLINCNDIQKRNLAYAYEFAALFLVDNSDKYLDVETVTFPAIHRIFIKEEKKLSFLKILPKVVKIIKGLDLLYKNEIKPQRDNTMVDIEAILVKKYCDNFK
jgi:hypothetical protein